MNFQDFLMYEPLMPSGPRAFFAFKSLRAAFNSSFLIAEESSATSLSLRIFEKELLDGILDDGG